jgi:hypothetical protein
MLGVTPSVNSRYPIVNLYHISLRIHTVILLDSVFTTVFPRGEVYCALWLAGNISLKIITFLPLEQLCLVE